MDATFIFLMVVLKLPILALLYLVWWAVRAQPEVESDADDDGGTKRPVHPRPTRPRRPRRGPHGDPPLPAPPRSRSVTAKARRIPS